MKLKPTTLVLALFSTGLGTWWTCGLVIEPLIRLLTEDKEINLSFFLGFAIIPMMSIPGLMALYYGIGLFKAVSKKRIKGSIAALSVFGALTITTFLDDFLSTTDGFRLSMLSMFIASCAMVAAYSFVTKKLIQHEGFKLQSESEFIGTEILSLLAFLLWLSLNEGLRNVDPGDTASLNLLFVLGPILVAWSCYKIAVKLFCSEKLKQTNASTI